jgi:hypothetical protein
VDFTKDEGREWRWQFKAVGGKMVVSVYDLVNGKWKEIDFSQSVWPITKWEFVVVDGKMTVQVFER